MENLLIGELNGEAIKALKAKHKIGIYKIETDNGHVGYFKNPNRQEVSCALAKASTENRLAHLEELAEITFIGGSEFLLTDDSTFFGITDHLNSKFNGIKAKLANL